jgi:glycosyltransferase involved in cell wall biosynthesis
MPHRRSISAAPTTHPRIAFFAPLSPMTGGVVDYSEELLPHLGEHFEIDVYTRDGLNPSNPRIASNFQVYGHSEFLGRDKCAPYTEVIYQVGCSADHVPDYDALLRRRGISVLHELNLSGILGAKTLARRRTMAYFYEMYRTESATAFFKVARRFLRNRQFPGYADYDMNRVALRKSRALIVHNGYMQRRLEETLAARRLNTPVHQVPLAVSPPPLSITTAQVPAFKHKLGLAPETFVLGSYGVVHESKRLSVALDAFGRLLHDIPNAVYLLVGPPHSELEVEQVRARGFGDRVRLTGHVEMDDFYRYGLVSDLCLNLRYPTTGGTSSALIRLMSMGKPVIVTNHAQFADLPDEVCWKLSVGPDEVHSLYQLMLRGAQHRTALEQLGDRARSYVEEHHTLAGAGLAYKHVIQAHTKQSRVHRGD